MPKPMRLVFARNLTLRYILVLIVLAVISVGNFFIFDHKLRDSRSQADLTTSIGQTRMLISFLMVLSTNLIDAKDEESRGDFRRQLSLTLQRFQEMSGVVLGERKEPDNLVPRLSQYQALVRSLVDAADTDLHRQNPNFRQISKLHDPLMESLQAIRMIYDQQTERDLGRLRQLNQIALAASVLVLLLIGFFVFQPMVQRIEDDFSELRRAQKEVTLIGERERRRIGQDLHDGLGQSLTGVALMSKVLSKDWEGSHPMHTKRAAEIVDLVNQSIAEVKRLVRGLVPVSLERGHFVDAFRDLAAQTEHISGIPCVCRFDEDVSLSDENGATEIYRIVQEALNNAVKHSRATKLEISLTDSDGIVNVSVVDDGIGLPDNVDSSEGFGLRIMRYRAQAIGGVLEFRRNKVGGTTVSLEWRKKDTEVPL